MRRQAHITCELNAAATGKATSTLFASSSLSRLI
jgi:hypothetical protein